TGQQRMKPVRHRHHTLALRGLVQIWVDGSQRGDGYSHGGTRTPFFMTTSPPPAASLTSNPGSSETHLPACGVFGWPRLAIFTPSNTTKRSSPSLSMLHSLMQLPRWMGPIGVRLLTALGVSR